MVWVGVRVASRGIEAQDRSQEVEETAGAPEGHCRETQGRD